MSSDESPTEINTLNIFKDRNKIEFEPKLCISGLASVSVTLLNLVVCFHFFFDLNKYLIIIIYFKEEMNPNIYLFQLTNIYLSKPMFV